MALTIRALVVLLIGLVVGSLMRPVEAQPSGSPFIVGQNVVLSLVNEGTINCVIVEKRADWIRCDPGTPDPFRRGPAEVSWYNLGIAISVSTRGR
jgi:hypothetical protein